MNLTQVQVEELQQAWKEEMAEIGAFGLVQFGIAGNRMTKEVALHISVDDRADIYRVLKHSTLSDMDALQAFLDAGGCNESGALLVTGADLKGRTEIPVSELLEMSRKNGH